MNGCNYVVAAGVVGLLNTLQTMRASFPIKVNLYIDAMYHSLLNRHVMFVYI